MQGINADRLKKSVLELSNIGYTDNDHGVYRWGFTDADMEARVSTGIIETNTQPETHRCLHGHSGYQPA